MPPISMTFTPTPTPTSLLSLGNKPSVAVMRDEGSNGDREMISALYAAGFQPWDIHVRDLLMGKITLDRFRGVVFVGGFSYADTLDSAKGWAGTLMFNGTVWDQLQAFYAREDTISLGVCNGCQLCHRGGCPAQLAAAATTSGENKTQEGTPANQPRFVQKAAASSPAFPPSRSSTSRSATG